MGFNARKTSNKLVVIVVVSIATRYGMDVSGLEPLHWRYFPDPSRRPQNHPASCTLDIGPPSRGQSGRGVAVTNLVAPKSDIGRAMLVSVLSACLACKEIALTFTCTG